MKIPEIPGDTLTGRAAWQEWMTCRSQIALLALAAFVLTTTGCAAFSPPVAVATKSEAVRLALAELDGYAQGIADANRFAGVVLIANGDEILFEKAYGKIDENKANLAPPTTRYNLASAGKMFTSVAILQQIAAGRITLDTRVGDILSGYPNQDVAKQVTIRHLLTHTAGTGDIDIFGQENAENRRAARSVAEMMALHSDRAPSFAPGSKQEYGNFGFVILGRILEVLSGESYENYLARHIFGPAGMRHTGFVDCNANEPDIAIGYVLIDGISQRNCATLPAKGFPAGGTISTARDMFLFVRALQLGALIPPEIFDDATRTHVAYMGLGFFATGYGEGVPARDFRWGHGGSADGINADVRVYPKTGEIVIVLANKDAPAAHQIAAFLHDRHNFNTAAIQLR